MTVVLGFYEPGYAILTADSRLSAIDVRADCCQKVFPFGKQSMIGFAGNLGMIAAVLRGLRAYESAHPQRSTLEVLQELPGQLERQWKRTNTGPDEAISMVLVGRTAAGTLRMSTSRWPSFHVTDNPPGTMAAIGSGAAAITRYGTQCSDSLRGMASFITRIGTNPGVLSFFVGNIVDSYLRNSGITSVGRVYHTLLLDSGGIGAVPYEMTQPGDPTKLGTRFTNGQWEQYAGPKTIPLLDPTTITNNHVSTEWVLRFEP